MTRTSTITQRHHKLAHNARTATETWLDELGTTFVSVVFLVPSDSGVERLVENHVDDHTTLPETVRMTMERVRARYAIYPYLGRWCLLTPGKSPTKLVRYYDTKEAAEMVAIHNG